MITDESDLKNHSSSHRRILQLLQENENGFFPSTHTILPHFPHNIDVLIGSFRVVSTLYIALPASGSKEESGVHEAISSDEIELCTSMLNPINNRNIPPNESGVATAKENDDPSNEIIIVLPMAIHIHAEITIFRRL
ncbi:MAG: hypothetical protein ACJZ4F_00090 [Candidatus Thalassarchaeaceae archaeon]|tara:strand:+ start:143 stop:553 length:411 start_codon:yes stop_codon:yes gene_type:complete